MKTSRLFALLVVSVVFCNLVFTQAARDDFGSVKTEQLTMSSYSLDEQAEAVVLYDFGKGSFIQTDAGYEILFERTTKIKIFSKAGLEYASVEIPYYVENNQMENVYDIEGYTYNFENGSIQRSKLDKSVSFDEKINDHWMVKKFAMPDVKSGSIIEYKYKVMSPYFVNFHDWEFQSRIPVIYSEYTVCMIPFYEYNYIFQGAKKFDVYRNTVSPFKRNYAGIEFPDNIFTFGMNNVPAFRDEAYITSINDYIMKIDFQLAVVHHPNGAKVDYITSWPLLIEQILKQSEFGLYMKAAGRNAEEIMAGFDLTGKSDRERAEYITRYVMRNYNWDGYHSKYAGQTVKDFLKTKTGNSADINLFLCSMLNSAGIQAYPVILSTRNHGKIVLDFPFQQFLNNVIVLVNIGDKRFLLDATEPLSPFGVLPARCINEKGLVVRKDKIEWVPLTDESNSYENDSVFISLNENLDSAYVSVNVKSGGHKALDYRRSYIRDAQEFSKKYLADGMKIMHPVIVQYESDIEYPFMVNYQVAMPVEIVGNKIIITPFPGLVPVENPLKVSTRTYPVDMIYPETNIFNAVIDIPKGYKFANKNEDVTIDNALVKISYSTQDISDRICITGSYSFRKSVYLQHEYYSLKNLYTEIVKTFNDKIVLEKHID